MRDAHLSGFHGASRDQWDDAIRDLSHRASVIAVTECRRDVAPHNWTQYRPKGMDGAECAILHDRNRWQQVTPAFDHRGGVRLTDLTFYTGKGAARPGVVATWALLARQTAAPWLLLRVVAHFPASVQRGDKFSAKARRVAAWVAALHGLRREVRRLIREHGPDEITVSCDFNVEVTRRHWRTVINTGLRGTGLRVKAPGKGTHRDRAIDSHVTTLRREATHVGPSAPGFDHRPVVSVLTRKENKK